MKDIARPTNNIIRLFENDKHIEPASELIDDDKLEEERINGFKKLQRNAKIGTPISGREQVDDAEDRILRPGQQYQRYRTLEDVSPKLRVLYAAAATRAAVS